MLFTSLLVSTVLVVPTLALPTSENSTVGQIIYKRSPPHIGTGFSARQTTQINDAFRDALELASYVVTTPRQYVDPIMAKYFSTGDFDTVRAAFSKILGPNPQDGGGNDLLSGITISKDFPDSTHNNELSCADKSTLAELRHWGTGNPLLILCDSAFTHGGIGKGYGSIPLFNVPAVKCSNFKSEVSWAMDTLGATLLHEYTHYLQLMKPPLPKETDDLEYGPYDVTHMDKKDALNNGDSFNWFATENLWTVLCEKQYSTPDGVEKDPGCGLSVCKALIGSKS